MSEETQDRQHLEIVIIGGGVCGLTLAVALAKEGVNAHIYEAAAKFGEIGAGIGIGQNAISILRAIGVFDAVLAKADETTRLTTRSFGFFRFFSGMDGHELIYDYPQDPEGGNIGVARSAFLDALVERMDPQYTHFNKRCVTVTTTDPRRPTAHFQDGSSIEADVILLANGIRGAGREAITGIDPRNHVAYSNCSCYRGLVPVELAKAKGVQTDLSYRPACFMGIDKHLIMFPIRGGKIINVVAFVVDRTVDIGEANLPDDHPTVISVTPEELLQEYEGWGPDVIGVLSCIEKPTKWYINVVNPPLDKYVEGNVALLGDAAHAMVPHLGAGAGQGIEDAYLLAKLLSYPETTKANIVSVLEVYNRIRRPRSQEVWHGSIRAAEIYEGYGPHGSTNEGRRQDLVGIFDEVWHHGANSDFIDALEKLVGYDVFRRPSAEFLRSLGYILPS